MSEKPDTSTLKGHRQRLRERLACEPQAVADYEVMELLLGLGIPRKDTRELSLALLKRFGSLRGALDAPPEELEQIEGFGSGLLALWRLLREIMTRYALSPLLKKEVMASPEAVAQVAMRRLGNLAYEESWLALVDAQNRLISFERLRRGSISSIALQPRDVLEAALLRKASGIILVHNHPGGNPEPSRSDLDLTGAIKNIAPHLGLRFLDHVIVTAGECYSVASRKLIRPQEVKNGN